jgi:hypothetical protein
MKKCQKKRNFRELDEALDVKLKPFLYNEVIMYCTIIVMIILLTVRWKCFMDPLWQLYKQTGFPVRLGVIGSLAAWYTQKCHHKQMVALTF